jgi:hypothetical protein
LENNSRQPTNLTEKRESDSLNKSQLTLFHGVDEGGVFVDEDVKMMMSENQSS